MDAQLDGAAPRAGRIVNATLLLHGTSGRREYRKTGNRCYGDGDGDGVARWNAGKRWLAKSQRSSFKPSP